MSFYDDLLGKWIDCDQSGLCKDSHLVDECSECYIYLSCSEDLNRVFLPIRITLLMLSGLAITFIGFFFLLDSRFKKHPYPLFAFTSLLQGIYYFSVDANYAIC